MKPNTRKTIWMLAAFLCLAFADRSMAQSKTAGDQKGDSTNVQQPRLWASKNGKFKITAALIACDENSATLQKSDESTIDVPLAKLCQADRLYLKAFRARQSKGTAAPATNEEVSKDKPAVRESSGAPFQTTTVPELLPLEEYEGIKYEKDYYGATWPGIEYLEKKLAGPEALEPDPMMVPAADSLKEAGMLVKKQDAYATVDAVLPVGGPRKLLMLGLSRLTLPEQNNLGAVLWLSLEEQKVLGKLYLPSGEQVIDYAPAFGRLLTVADRPEEGFGGLKSGDVSLTLWDLPPGGKQATALARWRTMLSSSSTERHQARILGEDHVIYSLKGQSGVKYNVVNVAEKKLVYDFALKPVFAFDLKVLLSPNRRYLFLSVDDGLIVKDSRSGKTLAGLRCRSPLAVACTPDGKRIAAMTATLVHVWEVGDKPTDAEGLQFPHLQSPISGRANIDWVDDNLLIVGTSPKTRVLIDVDRQYPIWEYKFDEVRTGYRRDEPLVHIANGYLIYPLNISGDTAVGCVKLPGAGVVETTQDFDPANALIMKRGTEVKLTIKSDQDQDQIRETIEKKIRDNGWVIRDDAKIEVLGTLNRTKIKDRIRFPDKNERSGYTRKEIAYSRVGYVCSDQHHLAQERMGDRY